MGYMTTIQNIEAVIKLIKNCFCNKERVKYSKSIPDTKSMHHKSPNDSMMPLSRTNITNKSPPTIENEPYKQLNVQSAHPKAIPRSNLASAIKLHEICVYPIKSCAPFRVDGTWALNRRGLKYDREWMIVRSTGVAMTQKSDTKLCLIQPSIDEAANTLSLSFPYAKTVQVPLTRDINDNRLVSSLCTSKVCGDKIDGIDCGDEVAQWLDYVLCSSGLRLFQQNVNDKRIAKNNISTEQAISLSNQAQFLLINIASVDWLTRKVENWIELDDVPEKILQNTIDRFRANLIVESAMPLEETEWKSIWIGNVELTTTGPCTRCQMICIDQSSGSKTTEPLQTIAREFNGKMRFGIYLCQGNDEQSTDIERSISCGDYVEIEK